MLPLPKMLSVILALNPFMECVSVQSILGGTSPTAFAEYSLNLRWSLCNLSRGRTRIASFIILDVLCN